MNITKNKQTHRHREQTSVNSGERGGGGADRQVSASQGGGGGQIPRKKKTVGNCRVTETEGV